MNVFKPGSQLTFETVMQEMQRFQCFLAQVSAQKISLELSDVTVCDSAGLAFLLEAKKHACQKNLGCDFQGLSEEMRSFVRFFGLEEGLLWIN